MRTQVVSVTNRIPDRGREPYYRFDAFIESLRRFSFDPVILGMGQPWWGLMTKPRRLRHWLRGNGHCMLGGAAWDADLLIVCDSYDVIFTAHPDKIGEKFGLSDEVMFNAEKGLFPRGDLQHAFAYSDTPWRYLNSGLFIGKPQNILAMLEAMNLDDIADDYMSPDIEHGGGGRWVHTNDQGWYQYAYAAHPVPMTLDSMCEIFQTCSACTLDEFDLSGEMVKNKVTGTTPLVWHFNGGSKNDLLPVFLKKWGLPE